MLYRMARLVFTLVVGGLISSTALSSEKPLRIGTLAPKNSLYHRQLLEIGEAWRQAQGGNAKYVVFPDGSQGGEAELARRMRIGQLQGALLSIVGLSEIEPSINALQSIPLLFKTWDEVDYVREDGKVMVTWDICGRWLISPDDLRILPNENNPSTP